MSDKSEASDLKQNSPHQDPSSQDRPYSDKTFPIQAYDLSLVIPVRDAHTEIPDQLENFFSFWANAPIWIEILLAIRSGHRLNQNRSILDFDDLKTLLGETELKKLCKPKNLDVRILLLPRKFSRGQAVIQGLRQAKGTWVASLAIDCSWPLGEVLRAYLKAMDSTVNSSAALTPTSEGARSTTEIKLWVANRRSKKSRQGEKSGLRKIFEEIEHEKAQSLNLADPTSPYFLIEKSALNLVLESDTLKAVRPWFFSPQFYLAARKLGLALQEIEVATQNKPESAFTFWDIF